MRQSRCNFHQNVTALSVPRSVKLAQTLVPRDQAPQLKIGESIHFDSHQAQMIQPPGPNDTANFPPRQQHPFAGSKAERIRFFVVEVARIIIAGIKLGY